MSAAKSERMSVRQVGQLAWTGLWWLIAVGGCTILVAACVATLPY